MKLSANICVPHLSEVTSIIVAKSVQVKMMVIYNDVFLQD